MGRERKASWVLAAMALATALGGCGTRAPEGPPTVPLSGKIVFTKGGDVFKLHDKQGIVEFQSVDQPAVKALGSINEDGSFVMGTVFEGGSKGGVVAGKHRVRLNLDDDSQHLVAPQFLSFERSGITVTAPSDQAVEVKVWK